MSTKLARRRNGMMGRVRDSQTSGHRRDDETYLLRCPRWLMRDVALHAELVEKTKAAGISPGFWFR
jgi:hypothetical protein